MNIELIIPAFIAGILTFLAPCTLPLVPGYLGLLSGSSMNEASSEQDSKKIRWKIFLNGLFFVAGFSLVFIVLGTIVAFVSASLLAPYRLWLSSIGGLFVVMFGFTMMNGLKVPFFSGASGFKTPEASKRGKPLTSLALGSAFGFGWTPCVGPILGSILLLASGSQTALQGAFLLFIFSLGLAIPFLLIALGVGSASRSISKYLDFVAKHRTAILAVFGFIIGFLFNPFIGVGTLRIGTILVPWIGFSQFSEGMFALILPLVFAVVFGMAGKRYFQDVDAVSLVGGVFFVYLGLLLFTNNVGLLISYGYQFFDFINYERLLDYL